MKLAKCGRASAYIVFRSLCDPYGSKLQLVMTHLAQANLCMCFCPTSIDLGLSPPSLGMINNRCPSLPKSGTNERNFSRATTFYVHVWIELTNCCKH